MEVWHPREDRENDKTKYNYKTREEGVIGLL